MRRAVRIALSILQALLFLGIFVFQRLSVTKMGVMRLIVYQNRLWNAALPAYVTWLIAAALLGLCLYALWVAIRTKHPDRFRWLGLALFAIATCGAALLLNTAVLRTYYYALIVLSLITLIQYVKCRLSRKSV